MNIIGIIRLAKGQVGYYDEKTNTLIILNGSSVDATFVDGVKQKGEK